MTTTLRKAASMTHAAQSQPSHSDKLTITFSSGLTSPLLFYVSIKLLANENHSQHPI